MVGAKALDPFRAEAGGSAGVLGTWGVGCDTANQIKYPMDIDFLFTCFNEQNTSNYCRSFGCVKHLGKHDCNPMECPLEIPPKDGMSNI